MSAETPRRDLDGLRDLRDAFGSIVTAHLVPELPAEERLALARDLRASRFARDRAAGTAAGLFRAPAWDMLVELFAEAGRGLAITDMASVAGSPSTGIRYIGLMVARGWIERSGDPMDARRHFAKLTPAGERIVVAAIDRLGYRRG